MELPAPVFKRPLFGKCTLHIGTPGCQPNSLKSGHSQTQLTYPYGQMAFGFNPAAINAVWRCRSYPSGH